MGDAVAQIAKWLEEVIHLSVSQASRRAWKDLVKLEWPPQRGGILRLGEVDPEAKG